MITSADSTFSPRDHGSTSGSVHSSTTVRPRSNYEFSRSNYSSTTDSTDSLQFHDWSRIVGPTTDHYTKLPFFSIGSRIPLDLVLYKYN